VYGPRTTPFQGAHRRRIRVRCVVNLFSSLRVGLIWFSLGILGRSFVPDNYSVPAVARPIDRVLKILGPVLKSGFTRREDKLQAIVAAFKGHWDLTYADVPVPKAGWPSAVISRMWVSVMPTLLPPSEADELATSGKTQVPVPRLKPPLTWSSSSGIAVKEDNASDSTETSHGSNPFALAPSTPKVAPLATSPKRPSRTATTRCPNIFPPVAPTKLNFAVASPSTPSRLPPSPLRSPRKLPDGSDKENTPRKPPAPASLLKRIGMASKSTPKLGK